MVTTACALKEKKRVKSLAFNRGGEIACHPFCVEVAVSNTFEPFGSEPCPKSVVAGEDPESSATTHACTRIHLKSQSGDEQKREELDEKLFGGDFRCHGSSAFSYEHSCGISFF